MRVARADQITLKQLRYRYPTRTPLTLQAEIRQIEKCIARGYKRLSLGKITDEVMCIAGFGPSLADTWREITHPCISTSGALDFLTERGFIPDYHAECDGRDHKTKHLEHPPKETVYLMASVCNPLMWDQLEGREVRIWHTVGGEHVIQWIEANDPGGLAVAGGSVIGLTSIHLAGIMGYRKFRLFGFDGNFRGSGRHAGKHYGPVQKMIEHEAGGIRWRTTPQMLNACEELLALRQNPELEIEVVGDSLMKSMMGN